MILYNLIIDLLLLNKMYQPGDFSFVKDKNKEEILNDAYTAIDKNNAWEYFEQYPNIPSNIINLIHNSMKLYENHSGASYSWTMLTMKYIAENGWDNFIIYVNKSD